MTHADRNTATGRTAVLTIDAAALRTVLLTPLLQIAACNTTTVKHENTLTNLEQMDISMQDEKIEASIYHGRYQKLPQGKHKQDSYKQAVHWYREYYYLYPLDDHAPQMSKLLAELYLEDGDHRSAAIEFEPIAKNDPASDIAAESACAALFAHRENLKSIPESRRLSQREHIAAKSLWFDDHYPQHAETASVLTAAAYDFLVLKNLTAATTTAKRVINNYPQADEQHIHSARIVLAEAEFESGQFTEAEEAYQNALLRHPDYLPARKNLGILCELYLHDLTCALKQYQTYLEYAPEEQTIARWAMELKQRIQ